MKISVVIPLYNKARYVKRALSSALAQTHSDLEVIVVNDGSTDCGESYVSCFHDPRIQLINQKNMGPGAARNRGLGEATGEFIAFLDADDEWRPAFLERCLSLLNELGPEVASVTAGYLHFPAGQSTESMWRRRGLEDGTHQINADMSPQFVVHLLAFITPCSTLARTDTLRQLGGFYARNKCVYGEDSYLWLKLLLNHAVAVDLEPLVKLHTEASALSNGRRKARPVEPMLSDPRELYAACPGELKLLLDKVLAIRAMKTACMLGYWSRWREARKLLQAFCPWSAWNLPRFGTSQLCATPLGAAAGSVLRTIIG